MNKGQQSLYRLFRFAVFLTVLCSLKPVNAIPKHKEANFAQQLAVSKNQEKTAKQLFNQAQILYNQGTAESRRIALEKVQQALKIWQDLGEKEAQAKALNLIGLLHSINSEYPQALASFKQSLNIWQQKDNAPEQAKALFLIGNTYSNINQQETALKYLNQALSIYKAENNLIQQARTLYIIGTVYNQLNQTSQSLKSFEEALRIQRSQNDTSGQVRTLTSMGLVYTTLGETQKAFDVYNQVLEIERQSNNPIGQSNILNKIGLLQISKGEHQNALQTFEKALQLQQVIPEKLPKNNRLFYFYNQALILTNIATAHSYLGNYQQAVKHSQMARSVIKKTGDRSKEAMILNMTSTIYYLVGNYQQQLAVLKEALELQGAISDSKGQINILGEIAGVHQAFGDYKIALNYYNQALQIARQIKTPSLQADTLSEIAKTYSQLSNYDSSINTYNQALQIYEKIGDKYRSAQTLDAIAGVWYAAKKYELALEKYQQALQIWQQQNIPFGQLVSLLGMTRTYESLQNYTQALDTANQALSISKGQNQIFPAVTYSLMSKVYQAKGDYLKALSFAQKDVSIMDKLGNKLGLANALPSVGKTYSGLKKYQQAINTFNREIKLRQELGDKVGEAEAQYNIAINQRILEKPQIALSRIEDTIKLVENIRSNVDRRQLRTSYFASVQKYYEFYVELLMQLHQKYPSKGYDAQALYVSERARNRSLVELLNEANVDIRKGVNSELLQRERDIQRKYNAAEFKRIQSLKSGYTDKQLENIKQEIQSLLTQLDEVQAQIRDQSPQYAALTQKQQSQKLTLKLPEIQKQVLDDDSVLLEYFLGEENSYLWAITKTGITSYSLPKRADIETVAEVFKKELVKENQVGIPKSGVKLSQMILAPVASQLGNKRLLIAADSVLQTIPFAALPVPEKSSTAPTPLLVNHEIVTLSSASSIAISRNQLKGRKLAPKSIAILADPVFSRNDKRIQGNAQPISDENRGAFDYQQDVCLNLQRLQHTATEAKKILSLLPKPSNGFSATGFAASRESATNKELSQYQMIHFATHGCISEKRPASSGLVFSLIDKTGNNTDGYLRLNDIYNLNLPAELVTLSACETAKGKQVEGEGLIGLSRGFMYAGAKRVAVSLWKVNDRATATFMDKFYTKMLKKGLSPSKALRAAQLEMWNSNKANNQWKAPYYWAAFTIIGDWE
ncbi:tetratricopeptide repeat protein [Calothrix sp. CCY 0018]|uniref:tetratricopeptide repeat protein n=1 Tax=Calothrix sp. CCY 0018 TaxID=3103864 RepID=UPI0039C68A86